jgi:hypothetical protein
MNLKPNAHMKWIAGSASFTRRPQVPRPLRLEKGLTSRRGLLEP